MPNPYLQVDSGAESKRYELEIGVDDVTIGRSTECHWVISSGAVSRRHARIKRRGGEITIEDLGSSNGTFVNGERLAGPETLHDQDSVKFGSVEAHFFAPPREPSEADATIAIGAEAQATILAKPPPPPTVMIPPPAESSPDSAKAPPEKPPAARTETGTHTVVPSPTAAPSQASPPPGATVAVPPPGATVAVPPPGATVAMPPPATSPAESSAPSETSVRPAPSLPSASQAISPTSATHGAEPSLVELAVIAGASFLVVFAIGAMLIRFVF